MSAASFFCVIPLFSAKLRRISENAQIFSTAQTGSELTAGAIKRYMCIHEEDGYSFHRFYIGITHASLRPSSTGVGYKAVFFGDEKVISQLHNVNALGYSIQIEEYTPKFIYKTRDSVTSGTPVTIRIDNFDVENYGQSTITAKVILQLNDGTIIESDAYSTTLRAIFEIININYKDFSSNQLSLISEWIQRHAVIKKWYVDNLIK